MILMGASSVAENGGVSIPQSLPTASQEAWRELEQPGVGFSSFAAPPFIYGAVIERI